MKSELQKKLFQKYPKIFKQKKLSPKETCMCWGIETGDGWYWLIENLCNLIQAYIDNNKPKIHQLETTQVKEKFGGLRFYHSGGDSIINGMIYFAENLSYKICEQCGSTENVAQTTGWISTLCDKCKKKSGR